MSRLALLGVTIGLLLTTAGCGGQKTYSLAAVKSCLTQRGAHVGGKLDFVAQTAPGGAFVTQLGDNFVTVVFGESATDSKQIELAYQRFAFDNVRAGLPDVLKRYNNVVTLWHEHPSDTDLALVTGCLK
jgi:hypothetical protein